MRRITALAAAIAVGCGAMLGAGGLPGAAAGPTQSVPLIAGTIREIEVGGRAGVPADAVAATLNVTVADPASDGYLTVFPCGEAVPTASNLNFRRGEVAVPNAVLSRLGSGGKVCLTASATTSVIVDVAGYVPAGSPIAPLPSPMRLVDTRDGTGAPIGRSGPGVLTVQVAGRGGIPVGSRAAVLNVTVVDPLGDGFATVFPCDRPQPVASNLNFVSGDVRPNLVLAGLDGQGRTCVFTMRSAHVVVDAIASVGAGTGLQLVANPERVLDTRLGLGAAAGPVGAGNTISVQVSGRAGVPTGAGSVVLNVTATESTAAGFVTAYPCGTLPTASNLNHAARQTIANLVVARLDPSGRICLYSNVGTHLVADVAGWFDGTAAHRVLDAPERLHDSRSIPVATTAPPTAFPNPPAPGPPPTPAPPPPPSLVFESTTSSTTTTTAPATTTTITPATTTTLPFVPIDTTAPCDVLVYPVTDGSIVVRDLITGVELVRTDPWFGERERPVVSRDCSGVYVVGAPEGASGLGVRLYGFDGDVLAVGDVNAPSAIPTLLDEADDGRLFATVHDGTWEVFSGTQLFTPPSGFGRPVGAARDGSVGAVTHFALFNFDVAIHSLVTGALLRTTTLPMHGLDPRLSPDGTKFAVGTSPTPTPWPPLLTTPTIRSLDGLQLWTYPLGAVAEPMDMEWISDTEVIVCVPGESPRIWTIGGAIVSTGAPPRSSCPTGG